MIILHTMIELANIIPSSEFIGTGVNLLNEWYRVLFRSIKTKFTVQTSSLVSQNTLSMGTCQISNRPIPHLEDICRH